MSAFCSKYPLCGCVDIGTKCYDEPMLNDLAREQIRKRAELEVAMQVYGIPDKDKEPSRNQPCPCGSKKKYKHCCADKSVSK